MSKYDCECCNFSSYLKSNYLRHLKTKKHLEKSNVSKMYPKCIQMYHFRIQNVSKFGKS